MDSLFDAYLKCAKNLSYLSYLGKLKAEREVMKKAQES